MFASELKLWNELMQLVDSSETFFYSDQYRNGIFRIFNYRLSSYTEFLLPGAMEARGIMFEIDREGKDAQPLRLASRTMEKFFNYQENPLTMDVDLKTITHVWDKVDGSLISTYTVGDTLRVKSKGSLQSEQAINAETVLYSLAYKKLYDEALHLDKIGYTVNMEYVAPDNRIVIGYEEPALVVLNVRHRATGEYLDFEELQLRFKEFAVKQYTFENEHQLLKFFSELSQKTGIEGVVVKTRSGLMMKMKTEAYMTAHRAKDSINSDRRLFEAVLEEATDDLRSLFHDDPLALKRIAEMEVRVEAIYNPLVDQVERFYERNKHLERKEYAILGQQTFTQKGVFGLAMNKYLGKEFSFKEFLRKHYKEFGIKDDPEPSGDE